MDERGLTADQWEQLIANQRVALERLDALAGQHATLETIGWWILGVAICVLALELVTHYRVKDLLMKCLDILRASRVYHELETDKRGQARQELADKVSNKVSEVVGPAVKKAVTEIASEQAAGQSGVNLG